CRFVVGANPPPMLLRESVVGECLLDCHFHQLGGPGQALATQLLDHSARPLQSPHQLANPGTAPAPPRAPTQKWSSRSHRRLTTVTRRLGNFTSAQVGKIETALTTRRAPLSRSWPFPAR